MLFVIKADAAVVLEESPGNVRITFVQAGKTVSEAFLTMAETRALVQRMALVIGGAKNQPIVPPYKPENT